MVDKRRYDNQVFRLVKPFRWLARRELFAQLIGVAFSGLKQVGLGLGTGDGGTGCEGLGGEGVRRASEPQPQPRGPIGPEAVEEPALFDFEILNAYKLAMDFTLFVRSLKVAPIDRKVFNHLIESAGSVVLSIAEVRGRTGRARLDHYEIALGSAGAAAAALDIVRRGQRDEYSERIRRVGGRLVGLSR